MSVTVENQNRDWSVYIVVVIALAVASIPVGLINVQVDKGAGPVVSGLILTALQVLLCYVWPAKFAMSDPEIKRTKQPTFKALGVAVFVGAGLANIAAMASIPTDRLGYSGSGSYIYPVLLACVILFFSGVHFEAPRQIKRRAGAEHIGGLRHAETLVGGASVKKAAAPDDPAARQIDEKKLRIGTEEIEPKKEVEHLFIAGTTGAGKSQIIAANLRAIRARGAAARVIILDNAGAYYREFGRPGIDVLLNPFDARSASWSPFAEIKIPADLNRVAASFVPPGEGAAKDWADFARTIFSDTMRAMIRTGERDGKKLYNLLSGPSDLLAEYLNNAGINSLAGPKNMTMFESAKGTLQPNVKAFENLVGDGDFSVRDWVKNGDGQDGWLFITYRDDQMKLMHQFVSAMFDLAIVELLSMDENHDRRLFFVADELDSLGQVSELKDGLTKARKYGGAFVLGIQTILQLVANYGKNAGTIEGNCNALAVLRVQDAETAEYFERRLGKTVVERTEISQNSSRSSSTDPRAAGGSSSGWSESRRTETRPVILASELQKLEDLNGVLVRGGRDHVLFEQKYVAVKKVNPAYVPRENMDKF